jgi:SlyX protein
MPGDVDHRLNELEIKASFAEDLLEQLNQVVVRQQQQIDRLQRELAMLRDTLPEPGAPSSGSLRDEIPPHW